MKQTILLSVLALLLFSCKKNDSIKATSTGQNTTTTAKLDTSVYSGIVQYNGYNPANSGTDSTYSAMFYVAKSHDSIYISATLYELPNDNSTATYAPTTVYSAFALNDSSKYIYQITHQENSYTFKSNNDSLFAYLYLQAGGLLYQSEASYSGVRIR